MRPTSLAALGIALLLALIGSAGAEAVDPSALIGEWSGKWVSQGTRAQKGVMTNGPYTLTIKKVVDNAVEAHLRTETGQGPVDRDVKARLDGDRLTFGDTQLTVRGAEMRGTRTGAAFPVEINLMKRK